MAATFADMGVLGVVMVPHASHYYLAVDFGGLHLLDISVHLLLYDNIIDSTSSILDLILSCDLALQR